MRKAKKGGRCEDIDSIYLQPIILQPFTKRRKNKIANKYVEYERRKKEWINQNPGAPYYTYEKAIKQIAREVGI